MSAVKSLAKPSDVIFMDAAAHDCLRTGARLSRAKIIKFKSADPVDLLRVVKKHRRKHASALIVTEKVFSVDGLVLPELDFANVAKQWDCCLVVDVSHSLGVWGSLGEGMDDTCHADVICGTFSKSLVTSGGFVAGSKLMMGSAEMLGLVTTANLSNTNTATALAALRLIRREPQRVLGLQAKIRYARKQLKEVAGMEDLVGAGAVIHLPCGHDHDGDAAVAWRILLDQGIFCQQMYYPAVALGEAGPRFAINATMTYRDLDHLAQAVRNLRMTLPKVQAHFAVVEAKAGYRNMMSRSLVKWVNRLSRVVKGNKKV